MHTSVCAYSISIQKIRQECTELAGTEKLVDAWCQSSLPVLPSCFLQLVVLGRSLGVLGRVWACWGSV